MSNKHKISYTDVNHILFNLLFFHRLHNILSSYGLTMEDVCKNPNKFRRFVHIYRHFRLRYNSNPFTEQYLYLEDFQKLFTIFIQYAFYYEKEKKNT